MLCLWCGVLNRGLQRVEPLYLASPGAPNPSFGMHVLLQVAVAEPDEDGAIKVVSATQGTDTVQGAVAAVLGLPHHKVTVGQWVGGMCWGCQQWGMLHACMALTGRVFRVSGC